MCVDGLLGVSRKEQVHLSERSVHYCARLVLLGRDVVLRRPKHTQAQAAHPHDIAQLQGLRSREQRFAGRYLHRRTAVDAVAGDDSGNSLQTPVMVVVPVSDDDRLEPPYSDPRERPAERERIRAGIHEHGVSTVAQQDCIALTDIQEHDARTRRCSGEQHQSDGDAAQPDP